MKVWHVFCGTFEVTGTNQMIGIWFSLGFCFATMGVAGKTQLGAHVSLEVQDLDVRPHELK